MGQRIVPAKRSDDFCVRQGSRIRILAGRIISGRIFLKVM